MTSYMQAEMERQLSKDLDGFLENVKIEYLMWHYQCDMGLAREILEEDPGLKGTAINKEIWNEIKEEYAA